MEVVDGRSSSIDLSSAPNSDTDTPPYPNQGPYQQPPNGLASQYHPPAAHRSFSTNAAAPSATTSSERQAIATAKKAVRKPRKPKEALTGGSSAPKEKPARKPRAAPGTSGTARKKLKTELSENQTSIQSVPFATTLQASRLVEPVSFHQSASPPPPPKTSEAAKYSENGFLNKDSAMQSGAYSNHPRQPQNVPPPQPSPPRSSQMYDPIRSVTIQRPADTPPAPISSGPTQTPPRPASRPGASPISSLVDPIPPQAPAPSPLRTFVTSSDAVSAAAPQPETTRPAQSIPVDLDATGDDSHTTPKVSTLKKSSSEAPTRASSPKPARAKEQPPPLPAGSGLLSASLFGGELGQKAQGDSASKAPNIVLHIDLKDPNNKVINFARLAEQKYGFAALHPRQAAARERLAKVAAQGAALERSASGSKFGGTSAGESGDDDISVDIDRDSDGDGDVAMSGVNGGAEPGNSGTDGPETKKKRRKKVEEYNLDDDFIDDSEQLWEAQAAASKDGFFVYCGPLVPEGEKPTVERADGTVKRGRGRGRGGGPGSRGGRGARSGASTAAATNGDGENTRPSTGPGSRGGTTTRRPRAKKVAGPDRQQAQQQKAAQEPEAVMPTKPAPYQA